MKFFLKTAKSAAQTAKSAAGSLLCRTGLFLSALCLSAILVCSCSKAEQKPLKMVFYPNESSESMKDARAAFQEILREAVGRDVEILTTTDYNIALEALVSGKADMAYVGAEGYLTAHKRNNAVIPIATNSGPSGTLDDAKYYSFIGVQHKDAGTYKKADGSFDLSLLRGKRMSFVAASSTSGYVIPARVLAAAFSLDNTDDLILSDKVFSKVLFAGSHQGSQVNLFRGDADAAAFAIPQTIGVYELLEGEDYKTGAVYRVTEGADEPFTSFAGSEMTVIRSIPVLNAPITVNTNTVSASDIKKIQDALTSDKTANNPGIFNVKDSGKKGIYPKYSEKTRMVATDDAWYDELRNSTK
ncbi:phosphate/phosphite/phosphonate ABC transporter substrate-binding protein [Treponema vincentii]|uniref:phosphate/phosphite/phosphonate ABC transporter substrate-binding protein n=1 Tax=Treponema vincentii TaxID=69710 RepID=UPI003D8D605C